MEYSSKVKSRDELLLILHAAIDHICQKGIPKTTVKVSSEIVYISNIYKQYCSNQLTEHELLEYFPVESDFKDCVLSAIESRRLQVSQHLVDIHNASNIPLLTSIDWDLKFILGSSTLAAIRQQKATLILNCLKGNNLETVSLELDRQLVEKLIAELEMLNSS